MRGRSLLILIILAAAAAYIYLFQWENVLGLVENARLNMAGYTPAKTPEDAMDKFAKAIKARDYSAASRYCTEKFANNLIKGKRAAYEIAYRIDRLINLMEEKGLKSDRSMVALFSLDPFPGLFQRSTDKKVEEIKKDGQTLYFGWFKSDPVKYQSDMSNIQNTLDIKMFRNALMPTAFVPGRPEFSNGPGYYYKVELKPQGEGDNKTWKLDIPLFPYTDENTAYLIEKYRGYTTGLDNLLDYIRRGRYDGPKAFEDELLSILQQQKTN